MFPFDDVIMIRLETMLDKISTHRLQNLPVMTYIYRVAWNSAFTGGIQQVNTDFRRTLRPQKLTGLLQSNYRKNTGTPRWRSKTRIELASRYIDRTVERLSASLSKYDDRTGSTFSNNIHYNMVYDTLNSIQSFANSHCLFVTPYQFINTWQILRRPGAVCLLTEII